MRNSALSGTAVTPTLRDSACPTGQHSTPFVSRAAYSSSGSWFAKSILSKRMVDGGALLQRSAGAEVAAFLNRSICII